MAINKFGYIAEGFSSTPSQAVGTIFHSQLKLEDIKNNKDGSRTAVYDWIGTDKLGFTPTIEATSKITPTSTLMSLGIRVPCGTFPSAVAISDNAPTVVTPWTISLTVRGGPSDLEATSLSDLKSLISTIAMLFLVQGDDGNYEAQSPVLNSLLRGNPNCFTG